MRRCRIVTTNSTMWNGAVKVIYGGPYAESELFNQTNCELFVHTKPERQASKRLSEWVLSCNLRHRSYKFTEGLGQKPVCSVWFGEQM